jgi:quercetin dioxygenase-like cupin family protein
MEFLPGGCRVFAPEDGERVERGTWSCRTLICRQRGARDIAERVSEYAQGRSPGVINPSAEEVLYVVRGRGTCQQGGFPYPLEPGVGVYIPPGTFYHLENAGPEKLALVAVCCPEDEQRHVEDEPAQRPASTSAAPRRTVREQERPPIPVADRYFKLLVTEELGCQRVTQFVGFIPPSRAPFHYHTYEEASTSWKARVLSTWKAGAARSVRAPASTCPSACGTAWRTRAPIRCACWVPCTPRAARPWPTKPSPARRTVGRPPTSSGRRPFALMPTCAAD